MTSRTADGKHTKRFIVLKKNESNEKFIRSVIIPEYFETKELAQAAIKARGSDNPLTVYKVRQK